jgi:hypothetical protein
MPAYRTTKLALLPRPESMLSDFVTSRTRLTDSEADAHTASLPIPRKLANFLLLVVRSAGAGRGREGDLAVVSMLLL